MEKNGETSINKMILDWEIWVLEEKGWVGRKNKGNLEMDERNTVEKNWYLILRMLKWSDPLEEKHVGWKEMTCQSRLSWRISIHMGTWEHHLGKVWNQHLTSKQLEYHNSKQNKGLACRISRNKHMIEISSKVFVVGPTRAQSYSTIMYKAVDMTYEASLSQHSQGLFKTQWDHCKTNRE